jgi:DNA-binding Lrp family transcriptional regulator
MIHAFVMARMRPGTSPVALQRIPLMSSVQSVSIVSGAYDLIIRVAVPELEQLYDVTNNIHILPGVVKTTTQIIEKEISNAAN